MSGKIRKAGIAGSARLLVLLVLVAAGTYAMIKMAKPYYAYKDLEGTMEYWARISLLRGDGNYSELREKMEWTIDQHKIPLSVDEVAIRYDPDKEMLTVSVEYDVTVEFPGYEYRHRFAPHVEVVAEE